MSDDSVRSALRSSARLVVVEAPAGCGKTYQGADFARDAASEVGEQRVLVLTHTHAAVRAFADRTTDRQRKVDIRTIDSLLVQIASAYHTTLDIPKEVGAWACSSPDRYNIVAQRVAKLLRNSTIVACSLADRYPVIICDEHQDTTRDQESAILALHDAGAKVRIFGDPMQRIFGGRSEKTKGTDAKRWNDLVGKADCFERLETPHRWESRAADLGQWILSARVSLAAGEKVDLRPPWRSGLKVIIADNMSERPTGYRIDRTQSEPIYQAERAANPLLVLAAYTETTKAVHALFHRKLILWEGHVRESLPSLVTAMRDHRGNPLKIGEAVVNFLGHVCTGFTQSNFGIRLLKEIREGCSRTCRGKPAQLQSLGRILISEPNHRGVAAFLGRLERLQEEDQNFSSICLDHRREFWEAIKVGDFDDCEEGLAEVTRQRTYIRSPIPAKAVSTIHKAKGLQCSHVMIMACDGRHFADDPVGRCALYVAMSRAQQTLTIVASTKDPSPLVTVG
jgi:DNA helicase-2/ATP-dependent DNA helicase PcrA